MEIIGYLLAILMGATLGLIGAGGSIIALPILVYFLGVPPVVATAYSLLLVGSTALIGGVNYYSKKQVDVATTFVFAVPSFIAVYVTRRWFVPAIPEVIYEFASFTLTKGVFIMLLFSLLMVVSSLMMLRSSKVERPKRVFAPALRYSLISIEGAVVGVFTGILGAGGGFLIIPALVLLAGLEMKIAVGSSLFIIAIKSLLGFVGDLQAGITLDFTLIAFFLTCTIIGMIVGTSLSKRVDEKRLKRLFAHFVLYVAVAIILKELF